VLLRIDGLDAGYGRTQVLRGLRLDLAEGEHLGLFGPNGHGKTTLLRTISGLIAPTAGTIELRGRRISGLDPRRVVELGIIHVPQGNTMFPGLTVRENLEMGAYVRRARAGRDHRLRQVFELFPVLGERQGQRSRTLSGGERQMLAIGVGLMGDPAVLMLDEPTLGLAPRIKEILLAAITEIERSGVTLVLVDQDVEFLLGLSDRLCLVERGRVAYQASSASALDDRSILSMYFGAAAASGRSRTSPRSSSAVSCWAPCTH
jgi:branched-chain amino acid transport system ATP-binding protein